MLSKNMVKRLNEHITLEFYSSNLYLQMSAWADLKGLDGCHAFLRAHAEEEMGHMHKLFNYVNETGAMALIGEIKAPPSEYKSVGELFQKVYEHECFITGKINELVAAAFKEQDFSTFNFLQWYVAEQHEEEYLFQQVLDKIKIIGEAGSGVFFIDRAVGELLRQK
ncbi:ferritin [Desulfuromonas versatilis]|uniref:Ferritin n=1 Tax=Desulfuromonas versatilis TaxID=2802975 RepID=A0ABM8HZZ9_9BACT|nr:non-heme ferritin [Desulfuromonas versatilis]BCR06150.1 ferritin [Desulfuromonas versatilis]